MRRPCASVLVFLLIAQRVLGSLRLPDTSGEKGHGDTGSTMPRCMGGRLCQCAAAPGTAPHTAHRPSLFPSPETQQPRRSATQLRDECFCFRPKERLMLSKTSLPPPHHAVIRSEQNKGFTGNLRSITAFRTRSKVEQSRRERPLAAHQGCTQGRVTGCSGGISALTPTGCLPERKGDL